MKHILYNILSWMLILLLLSACSQEDEPVAEGGTRTLMLNINVNTRAVTGGVSSEGVPKTIELWVYGADGNKPLLYRNYNTNELNWKYTPDATSGTPEYETTIPEKVEVESADAMTQLRVHAVVNRASVAWKNNSPPAANISEAALEQATFTAVYASEKENEVLMYGKSNIVATPEVGAYHDVVISAERCVAKMELYFTQCTPNVNLRIRKITLSKLPVEGSLIKPPYEWLVALANKQTSPGVDDVMDIYTAPSTNGGFVNNVLPITTPTGGFSVAYDNDNNKFARVGICPYLLEKDGQAWTTATGFDDIYPMPDDQSRAYLLKLEYSYTNKEQRTEDMTKYLALSRIDRNTCYRIFVRVHTDTPVEINTVKVPWVDGKGDFNIDITDNHEDAGVSNGTK